MPTDPISNAAAANIYAATSKTTQTGDTSGETGGSGGGPDFGAMLKAELSSSLDTLRAGEKASAAAVSGQGMSMELITAVNAAELKLQEISAINERLLQAYRDIQQTQI